MLRVCGTHSLLKHARAIPRGAILVRAPFFPTSAARRCCCCCLHSIAIAMSQD